jgi:hypothetical protein
VCDAVLFGEKISICCYPEDESRRFLHYIGTYLPDCMESIPGESNL